MNDNSPSTNTLIDIGTTRETNVNENNNLEKYIWKSCCGMNIDKRVLLFSCQATISIMTLILCIFMLITHHNDCDSNQMYSNILMMLLGVWLPQPNMKK